MGADKKKMVTSTNVQEAEKRANIFEKAINQIKSKNISFSELVKDTSKGEQVLFFGMILGFFLLIFGGLIRKLIGMTVVFVYKFVCAVLKEFAFVSKTIVIAFIILTLTMALIYSSALITFIVKSK